MGINAILNSWGAKTKLEDFLPFVEHLRKPQTVEDQMAIVEGAGRQWRQSRH